MYLLFKIKTDVLDLQNWGEKIQKYTHYLENWVKEKSYFFKNNYGHYVCNESPLDLNCTLLHDDNFMNCFSGSVEMYQLIHKTNALNANVSRFLDERYYLLIFKLECEFKNIPPDTLVFYPKKETVNFSFIDLIKPFDDINEFFNKMPFEYR